MLKTPEAREMRSLLLVVAMLPEAVAVLASALAPSRRPEIASGDDPPDDFDDGTVTIDEIEAAAGSDLFSGLDDELETPWRRTRQRHRG